MEHISITILHKLHENSFSVLGFLFILRDILGGSTEGVIDLKLLASELGVTMTKLYSFIGILEDSFIIRTYATPEGRHIELLIAPDSPKKAYFSHECLDFLSGYLTQHGIGTSQAPHNDTANPDVIRTACYMGEHFPLIRNFYSAVKSTLNDYRKFDYSLTEANIRPEDGGRIVSFARGLKNIGCLSSYEYKKSPHRTITAQVAHSPEAHRFISGGWLEHYIHSKTLELLSEPYAFMRNINVTLPENEQFEFDLLVCIREKIIWIESKTGKYAPYLQKYSRIAKLLGLSAADVLLVTAETPAVDTVPEYGITCCNIEEFPEAFMNACRTPEAPQSTQ